MAHYFSSGKPVAYCSRIRMEFDSMFDVSNLSARDQFEAAVVVSGVCLVAAVLLREWFADREIRIMARILGAAGWAVVVTFAWRMTETNETLATQIMVQKGVKDATSISDPVRVVAVASEYSATTEKGVVVSVSRYSGGRLGPLSVVYRRSGIDADANRDASAGNGRTSAAVGGSDGRSGSLSSGTSGVNF